MLASLAVAVGLAGELIGTLPATFYQKAQCILYTSPPAADTVSPRSAYAGSSWETVQRAIRFSLLVSSGIPEISRTTTQAHAVRRQSFSR